MHAKLREKSELVLFMFALNYYDGLWSSRKPKFFLILPVVLIFISFIGEEKSFCEITLKYFFC